MSASDEARLARRYPKRTVVDYLLFGGLGLGVAVTIALAAVAGVQQSNPEVTAMVRNFEIVSPSQIDIELVVQRNDPGRAAECDVFAQAATYDEVGEATLAIPPGAEKLTSHEFSINTVKEAVSADVETCRTTDG